MQNQWTTTTAEAALDLLDAAKKQIEAQMLSLHPGDFAARRKAQKTAPVKLSISLDLTDLVQIAADRQAFDEISAGIDEGGQPR